jgi:hypothetical protein
LNLAHLEALVAALVGLVAVVVAMPKLVVAPGVRVEQLITAQQALPVVFKVAAFQALEAQAALTQVVHQAVLVVLALVLVAVAVAVAVQALFCCAGNNWWDNPILT